MRSLLRHVFGHPWIPFVGGIALIAAHAVWAPDPKVTEVSEWTVVLWHVVRDLGIAFIIGAIIAGGIEQVAREERRADVQQHISAVHRGVVQSLLARSFPEPFIEFVLKTLAGEDFFQKRTRVAITLRKPGSAQQDEASLPPNKLIFEYEFKFEVENVTDRDISYTSRMFVEKDWDWESSEAVRNFVGVTYWKIGDKELSTEEIQKAHDAIKDEKYHLWYEFPVPQNVPSKSSLSITVAMKTVKNFQDATTWTCLRPCDGLEMLVRHPDSLEISINAKHPSHKDVSPKTTAGGKFTSIQIKEPMFPFTVVEIAWREVQRPNPPEGADVAAEPAAHYVTSGRKQQPKRRSQ